MRKGQQPPWIVSDELCGILFVLYTGVPWEFLLPELGFGSDMTCWRRLRDWNEAGVWQRLHESLLAELHAAGELDLSKAVVHGSHVRALKPAITTSTADWSEVKASSPSSRVAASSTVPA